MTCIEMTLYRDDRIETTLYRNDREPSNLVLSKHGNSIIFELVSNYLKSYVAIANWPRTLAKRLDGKYTGR